jgi:hypothetical protein
VLQPLFVIIGFGGGGGVGSGSSAKDLIADVRRFDEQLGTDSSETTRLLDDHGTRLRQMGSDALGGDLLRRRGRHLYVDRRRGLEPGPVAPPL